MYFIIRRRVKGLKGKKAWEYQRTISDTSLTSVCSPSPTPSPTTSPIPSPTLSPRLGLESKSDTSILVSMASVDESNLDFKSARARRYHPNFLLGGCNDYVCSHTYLTYTDLHQIFQLLPKVQIPLLVPGNEELTVLLLYIQQKCHPAAIVLYFPP